jgi:hypothetical protein
VASRAQPSDTACTVSLPVRTDVAQPRTTACRWGVVLTDSSPAAAAPPSALVALEGDLTGGTWLGPVQEG